MLYPCNLDQHVFTIDTDTQLLIPTLDLVPGRRCLCGAVVILAHEASHSRGDTFHLASIDSLAAQQFALHYPALATW